MLNKLVDKLHTTMQKRFSFWAILIVLLAQMACAPLKEPEFRGIQNMQVSSQGSQLVVDAEAIMFNPNRKKMTLYEIDLDVAINDANVGHILDSTEVAVPAEEVFYVPVRVTVPTQKVLSNLLTSLFSAAKDKKVEVQYRGHVRMRALGIKFKLPVNAKSKIKLPSF